MTIASDYLSRPKAPTLIGPLKFYNGWLCCHGNNIKVINPHRVEETIVYRQLMESHYIPATRLETPRGITERYYLLHVMAVKSQYCERPSLKNWLFDPHFLEWVVRYATFFGVFCWCKFFWMWNKWLNFFLLNFAEKSELQPF